MVANIRCVEPFEALRTVRAAEHDAMARKWAVTCAVAQPTAAEKLCRARQRLAFAQCGRDGCGGLLPLDLHLVVCAFLELLPLPRDDRLHRAANMIPDERGRREGGAQGDCVQCNLS